MGTPKRQGRPGGPGRVFTRAGFRMRLRELCEGVSQLRLQAMTGINHETMRRQLNGLSRPTVDQVARICAQFKVSANWLLFGDSPRSRRRV